MLVDVGERVALSDHHDLCVVEQLTELFAGRLIGLVLAGHPGLGGLLDQLLADNAQPPMTPSWPPTRWPPIAGRAAIGRLSWPGLVFPSPILALLKQLFPTGNHEYPDQSTRLLPNRRQRQFYPRS